MLYLENPLNVYIKIVSVVIDVILSGFCCNIIVFHYWVKYSTCMRYHTGCRSRGVVTPALLYTRYAELQIKLQLALKVQCNFVLKLIFSSCQSAACLNGDIEIMLLLVVYHLSLGNITYIYITHCRMDYWFDNTLTSNTHIRLMKCMSFSVMRWRRGKVSMHSCIIC